MKTEILIPTSIDFEWAKVNFPLISKIIMSKFFEENNLDTKLVVPKNMKFSFFHSTKGKDGKTVVNICKAKLRIKMPKEANSFCIEESYIKELKKIVKEKNKMYLSRGILLFPVINEKMIYAINIDKLTNDMIDENFVKDTYASKNTLSHRKQYFIPKEQCTKFKMSDAIDFKIVNTEKEINKTEDKNLNTLF